MIKVLAYLSLIVNLSDAWFYDDSSILEQIKVDGHLRKYYSLSNESIDFLSFLSEHNEINTNCRSSLKRWTQGIEHYEEWALKCKNLNGRLSGQNINFGLFDTCLSFSINETKKSDFNGKYCLVSIQPKNLEDLRSSKRYQEYQLRLKERTKWIIDFNLGDAFGVCMPSTCDINEIATVFNKRFKSIGFTVLPPKRCSTKNEFEPITALQIISFLILSTFVILCILSIFIRSEFLANFSLYKNFKTIYNFDLSNDEDDSKIFLHLAKSGLVFFSIALHATGVTGILFVQPYGHFKEHKLNWIFNHMAKRALLNADLLFFAGGFFCLYAWYDVVKTKKIKYNFFNFFFVRYLKVVILSLIITLVTFLLPHLGSGPKYSDLTNHMYDNCKESFWRMIFLVSNEHPIQEMCIIPSWYLSADFQIYIINYFVIYFLIVKPKLGFTLAFVQIFALSTVNLLFIHFNNISVIYNLFDSKIYDLSPAEDNYFHSIFHYNTYVCGMICAWLVKNQVKPKILKFRSVRILISAAIFAINYVLTNYLNQVEEQGIRMNKYLKFFLPVIDKFILNMIAFWFFYSPLVGYSAPLRMLSKMARFILIPVSQLNFIMIMCQFIYIMYDMASMRQNLLFDEWSMLKEIFAAYFFIFILGNFLFLFFEAPMFNLVRKFTGLKRRRDLKSNEKLA